MNKKLISFLLVFLLFSVLTDTAFAADSCPGSLVDTETMTEINDFAENEASLPEKFIVKILESLFGLIGVNSLSTLIFGDPYCVWAGEGTTLSSDGIFTEEEKTNIIDPIQSMISGTYVFVITLAILISSMKMGLKAHSPQGRADFWQDVNMWILSAFFMLGMPTLTNLIFELNAAFVQSIKDLLTSSGVATTGVSLFTDMTWADVGMASGISLIGKWMTLAAEWILALYLNIIYISRKIIIMLLLILGVVAAISLVFAKTRFFFGVWTKELIGNVFIQSIHSVILYGFTIMAALGAGTLLKLGMMIMFVPLTGIISKWLNMGDSSTKLGSTLTMMGMTGVTGAMMVAKQAGGVMRGAGQAVNGMQGRPASLENSFTSNSSLGAAGGASDSNLTSIAMNQSGLNSKGWNTAKDIFGKVGAVTGAGAGIVLGPAGAIVGAKVGQSVASGGLQLGRNIAGATAGIKGSIASAKASVGAESSKEMFGKNGLLNTDLDTKRQLFGGIGESVGGILGLKGASLGREIGFASSGISRQSAQMAKRENGGMGGFTSWDQLPAGSNVVWQQTANGSAHYLADEKFNPIEVNGQKVQLTPTGAGDPTLRSGEIRRQGLTYGTPIRPEMGKNGTYRVSPETAANTSAYSVVSSAEGTYSMGSGSGKIPTTGPSSSSGIPDNIGGINVSWTKNHPQGEAIRSTVAQAFGNGGNSSLAGIQQTKPAFDSMRKSGVITEQQYNDTMKQFGTLESNINSVNDHNSSLQNGSQGHVPGFEGVMLDIDKNGQIAPTIGQRTTLNGRKVSVTSPGTANILIGQTSTDIESATFTEGPAMVNHVKGNIDVKGGPTPPTNSSEMSVPKMPLQNDLPSQTTGTTQVGGGNRTIHQESQTIQQAGGHVHQVGENITVQGGQQTIQKGNTTQTVSSPNIKVQEGSTHVVNGEHMVHQQEATFSYTGGNTTYEQQKPSLQRVTDVEIVGQDGQTYKDHRVRPDAVNHDAYLSHSIEGANTKSVSDRVADFMNRGSKQNSFEDVVAPEVFANMLQSWTQTQQKNQEQRKSEVI